MRPALGCPGSNRPANAFAGHGRFSDGESTAEVEKKPSSGSEGSCTRPPVAIRTSRSWHAASNADQTARSRLARETSHTQ